MKRIKKILSILFLTSTLSVSSQTINWRNINEDKRNFVNLNAGLENGFIFGVGYGYKLNIKRPMLLKLEYSFPSGKNLFDDFKTRLGAQAEVVKINNFSAMLTINSIFRRHQTSYVRLVDFGSEFIATVGYYKQKWYVAGEFGFDKAIATHIKNSNLMKEYYPEIQGGWYVPTGGNFLYGIQAGLTLKNSEVYLKAGKTIVQDFKTTASLPIYFQLGVNKRF